MKDVYITRIAKFLPNEPIDNEQMEEKLGIINGKNSKARRIVYDQGYRTSFLWHQ